MIWVVLQLLLLLALWRLFSVVVWRPYALRKFFAEQGIRGPTYSLLSGSLEEIKRLNKEAREIVMDTNQHDIIPRVHPHYHKWLSQYGETFLYWYGTEPRIFICEPKLAKKVLSNKFGFYPKPKARPTIVDMLGNGLVIVEGQDWVRHRRAINPAFNIDKLKILTKRMAACTLSMLNGWKEKVNVAKGQSIEMEMSREFMQLTEDIIAYTAFGTSFMEGKEVFEVQMELQERAIASSTDVFIPGVHDDGTLFQRIQQEARGWYEAEHGLDEIMEECKTFFFAGHETTSHLLTWTMFLLSINKEWQEKLREEVLRECGIGIPDADNLSKLKSVNMVLLETLRLYSPALLMFRKASKEMKLGDLTIPKGTHITIPLAIIHRNKKYWGEDATEFKPMRFADGVKNAAKHPDALLPFSIGARACIGQNFAMMEGKTVMALILQRFSFSLSPNYKHAPAEWVTLQPQYGLPILLKPL